MLMTVQKNGAPVTSKGNFSICRVLGAAEKQKTPVFFTEFWKLSEPFTVGGTSPESKPDKGRHCTHFFDPF